MTDAAVGFEVLVVCTANHCRSPLAEHLLRQEVRRRGLDWTVSSAGTYARPGYPMHPSAARVLSERGIDTEGWTSTPLSAAVVSRADLVLTAEQVHRGSVVQCVPKAVKCSFTLLELAHLAEAADWSTPVPPQGYGATLLAGVRDVRSRVQPLPGSERDLVDPLGQPLPHFERCADTIHRALDHILRGAPAGRPEVGAPVGSGQ